MKQPSGINDPNKVAQTLLPKIEELGQLVLKLAEVNRMTWLNTRGVSESVTDHTVMLAIIACAVAANYDDRLDVGKIAQYTIVHDLVEAYAGDTATLHLDEQLLKEKKTREQAALQRIKSEFGASFPWLPYIIDEYEAASSSEAQFVKIIDKAVRSIAHLNVGCESLRANGIHSPKDVNRSTRGTSMSIEKYADRNPLAWAIREEFIKKIQKVLSEPSPL